MLSPDVTAWNGEELHIHHDGPSGAWIAIAIHSTRDGWALGGTRWRAYADLDEALTDVLRLSRGMTDKAAVTGLPCGGAKAVISGVTPLAGNERAALLERYADLVDRLGGRFVTGPDIGVVETDMDVMGARTRHVVCRTVENGGSGNPSPWTALGVLAGIHAGLAHATGSDDLAGKRVLVQGAGEVGGALASFLHEAGARVLLTDIDAARAAETARALPGAATVPVSDAMSIECDVFAPCAIGGILNATTIPMLRCAVVAGSANNQLLTDADAALLRERGIVYAPDFVISGGGLIRAVGAERLGWSDDVIRTRIEAIGDVLRDVFRSADAAGVSTHEAALRLALSGSAPDQAPRRMRGRSSGPD
jgi:leucine dehydrogenase